MNWKTKSKIQSAIALMPEPLASKLYFQVQRRFGRINRPFNPLEAASGGILDGVSVLTTLQKAGFVPDGKVFFEIGTGWTALVPLTLWLSGATKIITVDLNPLLKKDLIQESLYYIQTHEKQVRDAFGAFLKEERFTALLADEIGVDINTIEYVLGQSAKGRVVFQYMHRRNKSADEAIRKVLDAIK